MKPSSITGWLAMFVSLANVWPVSAQDVAGPHLSLVPNVSASLRLSLTNAGGGNYSIQRSTNLASWAAAHTLILPATNSGSLNVTNDRPAAFYRAVALPSVSQGRATTVVTSLLACAGARIAGVGSIAATDGTRWTVPAINSFTNGPKASDLYNDCSGFRPANINGVNLNAVPIVEVDADGQVITGFLPLPRHRSLNFSS